MNWTKISAFCILFLYCYGNAFGQSGADFRSGITVIPAQNLHIEKYGLDVGLSNPRVKCLLEHSQGFLWVGTENGLNRFDGYSFSVFDHSQWSKPVLSGENITRLEEIQDGKILITYGRANDSMDVLDPVSLALKVIPLTPEHGFSGDLVAVTTTANKACYLLSFDNKGLYIYLLNKELQPQLQCFYPANLDLKNTNLVNHEYFKLAVSTINGQNRFWVSNKLVGILSITCDGTQAVAQTVHPPLPVRWVPYVWELEDERYLHVEKPFSFVRYSIQDPAYPKTELCTDWYTCYSWKDGTGQLMFAGAPNKEVKQFDHGEGFRILTKEGEWLELPFKFVFEMRNRPSVCSRDFKQYFWIGGYDGLRRVSLKNNKVKQYFYTPISDGLYGNRMRGISADSDGNMVFMVENNAPFILNTHTGKSRLSASSWQVGRSLQIDAQGNFWGAGQIDYHGLARYELKSDQWIVFPKSQDQIYNAHTITADGKIWATQNVKPNERVTGRLDCIDPATGSLTSFSTKDHQNPFAKLTCNYLLETRDGILWVATTSGLFRIDRKEGTMTPMPLEDEKQVSSVGQEVVVLHEMTDGRLMIGTNQGLKILDRSSGKIRSFTQNEGLCNNLICGILQGESGRYWLSTYNGLSCFNPQTESFNNFYEKDGLTNNEFNRFSFYKGADGMMYFGGMNGVNGFFEKDLLPGENATQMFVSELTYFKDGQLESFRSWHPNQKIVIPAVNRYLAVKVGSFDMANPDENVFAYKIEGLDKSWVYMSNQHEFRFPMLPVGTYTLRIRSAPPNGNWSKNELALQLEVQEHLYKSKPFLLLYVLLLAGLIGLAWGYQKRRLRYQHELQRLQEMDHFKSRFFTNITHEFRTPLTVILGLSEQLESQLPAQDQKSKMGLIRRNGQNLLRLINEILDLVKLETHQLKLQYLNGDILAFLKYIAESLHSISNAQNVLLRVESTHAEIIMDYDPDRLLQIVHNLLSNAIKYTASGGKVLLKANLVQDQLQLQVIDTGVGIHKEDLPYVFDRYFQTNQQDKTTAGGSGIGLSLTKELVQTMGGSIQVESEIGKGAVFTVLLPVRQDALKLTSTSPQLQSAPQVVTGSAPANTSIQDDENLPMVLLVEDNPDVVEYLIECLNPLYRLEFAYNGRAGIEKALEFSPDLIVSDVMMPEMDGFEVCDFLKNDARTSHIPIVLLTAKADVRSRITGLRRGADAYLSKPFHREELLAQLQNLLEQRNKMAAFYSTHLSAEFLEDRSAEQAAGAEMPDLEAEFLQKLKALVEQHLADPKLSPEFICSQMGMSRTNLYRKLTALTHLPISLFVRNIRLQKANVLLQATRMNVSEVAFATGFEDPKYFSRVFSEVFGVPPSAFRNIQ